MYQRSEDDSIRTFYKLYADWMEDTPAETAGFVQQLQSRTDLPQQGDDYPIAVEQIRQAVRGRLNRFITPQFKGLRELIIAKDNTHESPTTRLGTIGVGRFALLLQSPGPRRAELVGFACHQE